MSIPLRILYHHRTGATDAQRIHIIEIVKALRLLGHEVQMASLVSVETPPAQSSQNAPGGWRTLIRALSTIPLLYDLLQMAYNLYAIPWLVHRARRVGAQAIYERHALFNVAGVCAGFLLRIPVIVEVNSPLSLEQAREGKIFLPFIGRAMERWCLRHAHHVLSVTTPLKNILISMGVPAHNIVVMPNGIDPAQFRPVAKQHGLDPRLDTMDSGLVLGFVGWFRPWHGIDKIIAALALVRAQGILASLILIGDGPARAEIERHIAHHGLQSYVIITGAIPHELIPQYLALVDVAVQPAANEYCCPMKVIEYMGMGMALIAPDQANLTELITDGHNGLLFEPGNSAALAEKIIALAQDPSLRQSLAQGAQKTIEERQLLWSANAKRIVAMFGPLAPAEATSAA